ncbi:MAG: hypothetical protein Q8M15_02655 [Bacteroidota bacterium]|nr:hypothetical protein [Bacteroidota bacterium]
MQYNKHNNMEEVFRNSLGQSAADSPTEKDWQEMRQLLIKEKLLNRKRKLFVFIVWILALGISTALILTLQESQLVKNTGTIALSNEPKTSATHPVPVQTNTNQSDFEKKINLPNSIVPSDLVKAGKNGTPQKTITPANQIDLYAGAVNEVPGLVYKQAEKPTQAVSALHLENQSIILQEAIAVVQSKKSSQENNQTSLQTAIDSVGEKQQIVTQAQKDKQPVQPDSLKEGELKKSAGTKYFYGVKKWGIGIYVAPENSYYESRTASGQDILIIANPGKKICNTLGMNLSYSFSQNFYLQTGVWYSQKPVISINETYIAYSGDTLGSSYRNYSMLYQGRYLEVPLSLKYYCRLAGTLRIYGLAGAIASFNLPRSKSYFIRESYENGDLYRDRINLSALSIGIAGHLAAGLELQLNDKWSIYVEPFYKYSFSPVLKQKTYKNIPVTHLSRSWGAGFGIIYHLNNIKL